MKIEAVVFDCDGILVDTEPLHYRAFQRVLEPLGLGHDFEHYLKVYIGFDDRDAFLEAFREGGRPLDDATLGELMDRKERALREIVAAGGLVSFPGVVELVRRLKAAGVPLAVASGALRREVLEFTDALGLRGAFDVIVAADDVARSKPDPESYLKAVQRLQGVVGGSVRPARCVAVEDTPAGIQAARGAALKVIAVTNSFPAEKLTDADLIVGSLEGLSLERIEEILE